MNEPNPTGLAQVDVGTQNRIEGQANLASREAPLILYKSLRENVSLEKDLDPDKFLDDLSNLRLTGVIDKQPKLADKLLEWGQNPVVLFAVYIKIRDSIRFEDPNQVIRDNLALAHILGMDRNSPDPRRQLAVDQIKKWQEAYKALSKVKQPKKRLSLKSRLVLTATAAGSLGLPIATPSIATEAQRVFSAVGAAVVRIGTLPDYGIASIENAKTQAPKIEIKEAPQIKFAVVDSNSPIHWDGNTMYVFNSTLGGIKRLSGPDLAHLGNETKVTFDNKLNGSRWIEATYKDQNTSTLYGWYHHEPLDLFPKKLGRDLTVPRIGSAVSEDNGKTWHDLGFVLDPPPNAPNPDTLNLYFAGGNGDFSVIPDQNKEYFYFFISNYDTDPTQQGIAVARIKSADLNNPQGKVWKWHEGKWQEPGERGRVTPVFAAKGDVHKPEADFLWGPSVFYINDLQMYGMLLNHSGNAAYEQEGIYLSFNKDLSNPKGWSEPQKIKDTKGITDWYPQAVGLNNQGTDKQVDKTLRLFVAGKSEEVINFQKPEDSQQKNTLGTLNVQRPNLFRPGIN